MKKTILRRVAMILPVAGLVGLMLSGFAYMGAFNFADSAEAGCGGRLPYRSCRDRDRHDRDEIKTIVRTSSTFDASVSGTAD